MNVLLKMVFPAFPAGMKFLWVVKYTIYVNLFFSQTKLIQKHKALYYRSTEFAFLL